MHYQNVLGEARRSARAQPVVSLLSALIVAALCAVVLLTAGKTVGVQREILGSIDAEGTRTIVVRGEVEAGLDSSVVDRIAAFNDVEWVAAFGPAVPAGNPDIEGGRQVVVRNVWASSLSEFGPAILIDDLSGAVASRLALDTLGFEDTVGYLTTRDGDEIPLRGLAVVPEAAKFMEPLAITASSAPGEVSTIVVLAREPNVVDALQTSIASVLDPVDPSKVSIESSATLASLRDLVDSQLGGLGWALVLLVFTLAGILVAAVSFTVVVLRRRDFGRRRALGASRRWIVALVATQGLLSGLLGVVVGTTAGVAALLVWRQPLPGADFVVALGLLALFVSVSASLPPALFAASREPLRELRIP